MLKMIKGAKIKDADKLNEEFEASDKRIISNVNSNKILKILNSFINMQNSPLFLIIEVPSNIKDENPKNNVLERMHKDIYYADGMSRKLIKKVLSNYGDLFINDGLAQIGIGNHETHTEIVTDKYNIIHVYIGNEELEKYEAIFIDNKIKKVDKLTTAWDYFTRLNPGKCMSIEKNGKTVYDVINILEDRVGLYYSEQREE